MGKKPVSLDVGVIIVGFILDLVVKGVRGASFVEGSRSLVGELVGTDSPREREGAVVVHPLTEVPSDGDGLGTKVADVDLGSPPADELGGGAGFSREEEGWGTSWSEAAAVHADGGDAGDVLYPLGRLSKCLCDEGGGDLVLLVVSPGVVVVQGEAGGARLVLR